MYLILRKIAITSLLDINKKVPMNVGPETFRFGRDPQFNLHFCLTTNIPKYFLKIDGPQRRNKVIEVVQNDYLQPFFNIAIH